MENPGKNPGLSTTHGHPECVVVVGVMSSSCWLFVLVGLINKKNKIIILITITVTLKTIFMVLSS